MTCASTPRPRSSTSSQAPPPSPSEAAAAPVRRQWLLHECVVRQRARLSCMWCLRFAPRPALGWDPTTQQSSSPPGNPLSPVRRPGPPRRRHYPRGVLSVRHRRYRVQRTGCHCGHQCSGQHGPGRGHADRVAGRPERLGCIAVAVSSALCRFNAPALYINNERPISNHPTVSCVPRCDCRMQLRRSRRWPAYLTKWMPWWGPTPTCQGPLTIWATPSPSRLSTR